MVSEAVRCLLCCQSRREWSTSSRGSSLIDGVLSVAGSGSGFSGCQTVLPTPSWCLPPRLVQWTTRARWQYHYYLCFNRTTSSVHIRLCPKKTSPSTSHLYFYYNIVSWISHFRQKTTTTTFISIMLPSEWPLLSKGYFNCNTPLLLVLYCLLSRYF